MGLELLNEKTLSKKLILPVICLHFTFLNFFSYLVVLYSCLFWAHLKTVLEDSFNILC